MMEDTFSHCRRPFPRFAYGPHQNYEHLSKDPDEHRESSPRRLSFRRSASFSIDNQRKHPTTIEALFGVMSPLL